MNVPPGAVPGSPAPQGYYGYPPPFQEEIVFHPRYGYLPKKKLGRKLIRKEVNIVSGAALGMLGFSLAVGVLLGIFFAFTGVFADPLLYPESSGLPPYLYHALNCATSALGTGLPFALILAVRRPRLEEYLRIEKTGFLTGLLFAVAGAGICLAANYPAMFISDLVESFGFSSDTGSMAAANDPFSAALYFISVAILPPLFEEFAFRGVMLSSLRRYGDAFALVTSAMLFGFMHMNVASIPFAFLAGLAMGYIYLVTGNIWVNIAVHFLNNAQAVAGELLLIYAPRETAYFLIDFMFYGLMGLGLVAIILLAVLKKLKFHFTGGPQKEEGASVPASSKAAALFTSPAAIILILCCLLLTVSSMTGGV